MDNEERKVLYRQLLVWFREEIALHHKENYYYIDRHTSTSLSESVKDALKSDKQYVQILAPTGSGKTYEMIHTAIDRLNHDKFTVIVVQDKSQMKLIKKRFDEIEGLEFDNRILYLQNGVNLADYCYDDLKVIVTHQTYLGRQGESPFVYKLYDYISDVKPLILIDVFRLRED